MRERGEKMSFSDNEKGKVWKDYMERIMNEENESDHNVENVIKRPIVLESRGSATGIK